MHRRRSIWLLAALPLVLASSNTLARTLHVDANNQTGSSDGSPEKPYASIQDAIGEAKAGDEIRVAAGTYSSIVVKKKLELLGGYAGGSTADYDAGNPGKFSKQNRDANITRIEGGGKVVNFNSAPDALLDGFYVSGGSTGVHTIGYPPGDFVVTIRNNVIEDNSNGGEGGGIMVKADALITGNVVRRNRAAKGAGIWGGTQVVRIMGNLVEDNVGTNDHGGGIYISVDELVIANNIIRRNEIGKKVGYGFGGGVVVFGTPSALIYGNVISENKAPDLGSGLFIDDETHAVIKNELIYNNHCSSIGGSGITIDGLTRSRKSHATISNVTVVNHACKSGNGHGVLASSAIVTVKDSLFWNNGSDLFADGPSTMTVTYSTSAKKYDGQGNDTNEPLFADPAKRDFHLKSTKGRWDPAAASWKTDSVDSPGIDGGDPGSGCANEPAPNGEAVNRGAYGNTPQASKSKTDSHGTCGGTAHADGGPGLPDGSTPPPPGDRGIITPGNEGVVPFEAGGGPTDGGPHSGQEAGTVLDQKITVRTLEGGCSLAGDPALPLAPIFALFCAWLLRRKTALPRS